MFKILHFFLIRNFEIIFILGEHSEVLLSV